MNLWFPNQTQNLHLMDKPLKVKYQWKYNCFFNVGCYCVGCLSKRIITDLISHWLSWTLWWMTALSRGLFRKHVCVLQPATPRQTGTDVHCGFSSQRCVFKERIAVNSFLFLFLSLSLCFCFYLEHMVIWILSLSLQTAARHSEYLWAATSRRRKPLSSIRSSSP